MLPAKEAAGETGIQRVLLNKYYIDELYDRIIVRPTVWLSRKILWRTIDAGAIDSAAVNGAANTSRFVGWIGTRFQTGNVGTYVLVFVVGVLAVLHAMTR